jgi:pimeloyl-ACP methyl ester carboxylesterase
MAQRKWLRGWVKAALVLVGGYAAVLGLARFGYRWVLYPAPPKGLDVAPPGATLRRYTASDGVPVQALVFPRPGVRTVVFFHGNGETIAHAAPLGAELAASGLGFVAVEYRGYGGSRGRGYPGPTEEGLYRDAEAVLEGLRAEGVQPADVVLWGSSLGSGVAVEMAVRGHAARLILSSAFTSVPEVAARFAPVLPYRLLLGDRYDNLAKAARIELPTLLVHGDVDQLVPYDMGQTLSQTIPGARLVTVSGAGHNDLFTVAGRALLDTIVAHAKG